MKTNSQPNLRFSLFKIPTALVLLASALLLQACTMPTLLKPNIHEISASRSLTYDVKKPDTSEVTIGDVAKAVAKALPMASKYKAYNTNSTYIRSQSCIGDCRSGSRLGSTGPTGSAGRGLNVYSNGNQVHVQYRATESNSSGTGESTTEAIIVIKEDASNKGSYILSVNNLTEKIDISPGSISGLSPVAPIDKLAEDVVQALEKIKPALSFTISHSFEFSSPYPPESVLSSYERKLGKAKSDKDSSSSTLVALFGTPENLTTQPLKIEIYPYKKNESFIKVRFYADYQLLEGGGNNFPSNKIKSLENNLRKIATE